MVNRVVRSTKAPIADRLVPMMRSPSLRFRSVISGLS